MNRCLKKTLKTAAGALVAAALLASAWTVWNHRATAKLEAAMAALREAGLPTRLEELRRPPVPPGENAAPLYQAAFALLETVPDGEALLDEVHRGIEGSSGLSESACEALPRFEEALAMAHRAALKPRCDFGLRYEEGFDMKLSHFVPARKIAGLLCARALDRAQGGGRIDAAIVELRAAFALSRALGEEPILISQLVRLAVAERALRVLGRILPLAPSAVEAVEEVRLDSGEGAVARGLRGEVAASGAFLGPEAAAEVVWPPLALLARPYLKADLAWWLENERSLVEALAKSYPQAIGEVQAIETALHTGAGRLSGLIAPALVGPVRKEARVASLAALARLAAEVLDHRRLEGAFPESLAPFGGSPHLTDPSSGKPFRLVREEGRLYLESPGDPELRWPLE